MSNILSALFQDIADAIRSKTGETSTMKPAEFPEKITAINSGGSVEGTYVVTFCNYDGTELYSRLVLTGDDCHDPIAQGKINEPTRESTAANTYAYDGWSLTQGGAASASALKVVTADRTVYAAYTENVRYYTVRFYDGTTLMQEMQVAYGSVATAPPTFKDGYNFIDWTPSDLTIYADTDFYGTWEEVTYASLMGAPDEVPLAPVVGNAFIGDETNLFVAAQKRFYVYNVTGDAPTKVTHCVASVGNVRDVAICANGQAVVAAKYVESKYAQYVKCAFKVTSNNSINDATSTYFGAPSTWPSGFYYWETCRANRDGSRLLISAKGGTFIYDCTTTPFTLLKTLNSTYKYAVWGADNDTLYYTRVDGMVIRTEKYTISTEETSRVYGVYANSNTRLAINHDCTRIAAACGSQKDYGNIVTILNTQTGAKVRDIVLESDIKTFSGSSPTVYNNISYSPDGKTLAVACKDNVYFYDATDDKYTLIDSNHQGYDGGDAYSVNYNSSGNMVAVGSNVAPYVHLYKIQAPESTVETAEISGAWRLNETVTIDQEISQSGINIGTAEGYIYSSIHLVIQDDSVYIFAIMNDDAGTQETFYAMNSFNEGGWVDDRMRDWDFSSEPQTVTKEFYNWLTANATQTAIP